MSGGDDWQSTPDITWSSMTPVPADATAIAQMQNFVTSSFGDYPLLATVFYIVLTVWVAGFILRNITGAVEDK